LKPLASVLNDVARAKKRKAGEPLEDTWYRPEKWGGHLRGVIEDELHKLKRLRAALNNQHTESSKFMRDTQVALSKERILEVCDLDVNKGNEKLQLIKKAICHPDTQNTAVCEWIVMCPELPAALRKEGHFKDAVILELFGAGFEAFEKKGYTVEERTSMLMARNDLIASLYGNRLFDPDLAGDGHVAGLTRQMLLAMHYNGDCRSILLELYPQLSEDGALCEQSLGSNGCETFFSVMQNHIGYDPPPHVALAALLNIIRRNNMLTDPDAPNLPMSCAKRYPHKKHMETASIHSDPNQREVEMAFALSEVIRTTRKRGSTARDVNVSRVLRGQVIDGTVACNNNDDDDDDDA